MEAVLKCDDIKEKLIDKLMTLLSEECKHLCSMKFNSLLKKYNPQQLLDFGVENLMSVVARCSLASSICNRSSIIYWCTNYRSDDTYLYGWLYSVESKKYSHLLSNILLGYCYFTEMQLNRYYTNLYINFVCATVLCVDDHRQQCNFKFNVI